MWDHFAEKRFIIRDLKWMLYYDWTAVHMHML